jgi:hypothetical protein
MPEKLADSGSGLTFAEEKRCDNCGGSLRISYNKHFWMCQKCSKTYPRFKDKPHKRINSLKTYESPKFIVFERLTLKPFGHVGDVIQNTKTGKLLYLTRRNREEHFFRLYQGWSIQKIIIEKLLFAGIEHIVIDLPDENKQLISNIDNFITNKSSYNDPRIGGRIAENFVVNEKYFKELKAPERIEIWGY